MLRNRSKVSSERNAIRLNSSSEPNSVRVWRSWIIVEIGFLLAVIALFNLFPQLIGISRSPDAVTANLPFTVPGIVESLPWLNLWWVLALTLNFVVVVFTIRTPKVKWARVAINLFGLVILVRLVLMGPLVGFNPEWVSIPNADPSMAANLENELAPVLSLVIAISLSIAIAALSFNSLMKIRFLLESPMRTLSGKLDGFDSL
jgi:hypothetical protein